MASGEQGSGERAVGPDVHHAAFEPPDPVDFLGPYAPLGLGWEEVYDDRYEEPDIRCGTFTAHALPVVLVSLWCDPCARRYRWTRYWLAKVLYPRPIDDGHVWAFAPTGEVYRDGVFLGRTRCTECDRALALEWGETTATSLGTLRA